MLLLSALLVACGPDGRAYVNGRPVLSVDTPELTFPATAPDGLASLPLVLTNTGSVASDVHLAAPAPFSVERADLRLGAGASTTLTVYFQPRAWADVGATLTVWADGLPEVSVGLVGPVERDADADGAEAEAAGGTDCDDGDAAVHPGAADICGDGVDTDCALAEDCDGDGAEAGVDCDDSDAAAYPGAAETGPDGRDEDCDGRVDEVLAATGDLVITEIAPQTPAWIEVCNAADRTFALDGVVFETTAGADILTGTLDPGACASICASEADACTIASAVVIDPDADFLTVSMEGVLLDAVRLDETWAWEIGSVWSLDSGSTAAEANNTPAAWCFTAGTPASPNPACP